MKQWKGFLAGAFCSLFAVALVVTAGAKTGTVTQELTYRDIRVSLDGKVLDLRNAIGEPVEPFMFGGTNYLPVRALAEALGLNVAWDGAEVMVVLTSPEPPSEPEPEASAEPDAKPKAYFADSPEENFYTWDIPENAETKARYVLNLRSRKIHDPNCQTVPRIAPQDYATSDRSLEELLADEFTICGVCHADGI